MSDVEFRIKRKKRVSAKEAKEAVDTEGAKLDAGKRGPARRERPKLRKRMRAVLPKYETDRVISRILEEATNNEHYFKPMQLILTEGKKDLVD